VTCRKTEKRAGRGILNENLKVGLELKCDAPRRGKGSPPE